MAGGSARRGADGGALPRRRLAGDGDPGSRAARLLFLLGIAGTVAAAFVVYTRW